MGRLSAHKLSPGDFGTGPERGGGSGCGWVNGRSRDDTHDDSSVAAVDNADVGATGHACRSSNNACSCRDLDHYRHEPSPASSDRTQSTSRQEVPPAPKFSKLSFVVSF